MSTATLPAADTPALPVGAKALKLVSLILFTAFVAASGLMLVGTLVGVISSHFTGSRDFISYWATGHELVHHRNPYDPQSVLALERAEGFKAQYRVLMMRNTPNALFLAVPLGLMSARAASITWSLVLAACFVFCVETLIELSGTQEKGWLRFIGYLFAPALICIVTGQTSIFALTGIVLFLRFHQRVPLLAGAALSLSLVKPHLFLPFLAVLLVWMIARRKFVILGGIILAVAAASLVAMYFDPHVWQHYRTMMQSDGIEREFVPSTGTLLRQITGSHAIWIQLLPALMASLWSIRHFLKNRATWNWTERMPLLMLLSLAAAPYAWFADQTIALAGLLLALEGLDPLLLALLTAAALERVFGIELHSPIYLYQSIAWLAWYLLPARMRGRPLVLLPKLA